MVSRPTVGTIFRFTASSAMSRTVQRARPWGGDAQTMAMICCPWRSFSRRAAPGRGASYKARSRPWCTYRQPMLRTPFGVHPSEAATWGELWPPASKLSTCARWSTRTGWTPPARRVRIRFRSLRLSFTISLLVKLPLPMLSS